MKNYGLIGYPLTHSFSKKFFTDKFSKDGIAANYINYELEKIDQLPNVFSTTKISGLNVTIPYKKSVIAYLDELDEISLSIGAVNTILPIVKNGKLYLKGYNTDVYGFKQSIRSLLKSHHQKALILGTGGASLAVAYVLKKYGLTINFISRNKKSHNVFSWDQVNENMIKQHGIIINTTPVGMFPNTTDCLPFPFCYLDASHLVVDLIYNPEETLFLKNCKLKGAQVLNGSRMLTCQALKSWEIWNQH